MRRLRDAVARTYLDLDLRSLGLFRIGYAAVLLYDLYLRAQVLDVFYTNAGLLPNHTLLWAPVGPRVLSLFYTASTHNEALVLMILTGLCFGWLLIGYRTRLAQFASYLALLSLDARLAWLANGGDVVLSLLGLWTLFLPLGERFSLDALLRSGAATLPSASRASVSNQGQSVRSLACFALLLQFTAIYAFNAAQKTGPTWRDGSAVHYTLHQDRLVKPLGVWTREHAPPELLRGLTRATIFVEAIGAGAIFSPVFSVQARALAMSTLPLLHIGFELFLDLGVFSFAMMSFFPLLLGERHWRFLTRHFPRVTALARRAGEALVARRDALRAWSGVRTLETASEGADAKRAAAELRDAGVEPPAVAAARGAVVLEYIRRARIALRESCVAVLVVATIAEALHANPGVPESAHFQRPEWLMALVQYPRAFQAWRMFAPHAPLEDYMIEVDAVTEDGRHVDPYNQIASRVAGPGLSAIPPYLHQNQFFTAYSLFIWMPQYSSYLQAFREWILRYHERSGRPQDRVISFRVYKLTDQSPPPGQTEPTNFRRELFLHHPM